MFCILFIAGCINRLGCSFWPLCTPAWAVQKTEYSAPQAPPVPLQLNNITEIDVILGSGATRSMLFVLTGPACRPKSPVEGVLGPIRVCPVRMQPFWPAEYSQKCTVLPGGPVRAAKTMPMSLSSLPFCCTDFSECRARISQPAFHVAPEGRGIRFIASSARAEGHLMWPSCEQDCPSRKPYIPPLRRHTGVAHKLSPGIQKI